MDDKTHECDNCGKIVGEDKCDRFSDEYDVYYLCDECQ